MSNRTKKREHGFSLLEMTVAMALGTLVLGAAVQLYTQGVNATFTVQQRAEMQQDFRAASNMILKDLSLAGAGLQPGAAIALPTAVTPVYGCDQSGTCYLGVSNTAGGTYPKQGTTPYLYGLIPGYLGGPTISTPPGQSDTITVVYTDTAFYLNCYTATVTAKGFVTFAPAPAVGGVTPPFPPVGCLPSNVTASAGVAPQYLNDAVFGLTAGDVVLMTFNGTTIVAEVTGTPTNPSANTFVVPFANSDTLHMNQTASTGGLNSIPLNAVASSTAAPCGNSGPCRIFVITYYIDGSVTPPRLMRQVNGHTPMPMADSTVYMKFSYDLFNDSTVTPAINQPNPGSGDANDTASSGLLPNQITKINVLHMATDSALQGTQGYQGLDLETSVAARNLTYANDYPQ